MEKSSCVVRGRNWACMIYEESASDGWKDIIYNMHVPCFISPCHNKDVHKDGSPVKPHYHVLFMYDGNKSYTQVKKIFEQFGGVGAERVESLSGYAMYLCHLNEDNKHHYSPNDVLSFGGADYSSVCDSKSNRLQTMCDILDFCADNNVCSFWTLVRYSRKYRSDWLSCLMSYGSVFIDKCLKSKAWTDINDCDLIVSKNGEILLD